MAAIVGMAIVGAACAARSPASSTSAPDPTSAPAPTIALEPATEEAYPFELAGVSHDTTCAAIRPDMVGAEVIDVVVVDGRDTPVHRVLGVEPDVLVAVRVPGGGCTEHDPDARSSPWSAGYPVGSDIDELQRAVCAVGDLSASQYLTDRCHLDEDLVTCGAGPAIPPWVLDDVPRFPLRTAVHGEPLELHLDTDDPAVVGDWRVIVESWWEEPSEQLLLRPLPTSNGLEFLVVTAFGVVAGPAPCDATPA